MNKAYALLLAIPLALGVGCGKNQAPPLQENYNDGYGYAKLNGTSVCLIDEDHDGLVDVIEDTDITHALLFKAEGYQGLRNESVWTETMTPEMRETASRIMAEESDLEYRLAKLRFEHSQKKQ
ncbi:MAG: hypothetical protein V1743_00535 [Nanoarchaeota archaeon]